MARRSFAAGLPAAAVILALLSTSCVDSPAAPDGETGPISVILAPSLALTGPSGTPAATAAQEGALGEAFQRVDRFRVEVTDGDGAMVLDTVVAVTPGQDEYDLQLPVAAAPGETLGVRITAYEGATELFRSEEIQVQAAGGGEVGAGGGEPVTPVQISLSYSGPGATAVAMALSADHLVLGPDGTGSLTARVLDEAGATIPDVPLAWSSTDPGVVAVEDGAVSAVSDGLARVVAATPTGLEAEARVYVLGGELAFVEGGALKTREPAGGRVTQQSAPGASRPAWAPDGSRLFYVSGGAVRQTGIGAPLLPGSWPSLSPDGTKLALERDGRVWFSNDDGRNPTEGPSGAAPVWNDASTLLVSGGSLQRVRADGAGRQTLVGGPAGPPVRATDGRVAYVADGALRLVGTDSPLLSGARGRPTWSADGRWLAVGTDRGIVVVPADGSAPAVPLPGLKAASEPSFRPTGRLAAPPVLSVTGLDPSPPVPGDRVRILGTGFDWIIPANNRVVWPTRDGSVPGEILSVAEGAMEVMVPRNVIAGEVGVENRHTRALLAFEPTLATLEVVAATLDGRPVPGVEAVVRDAQGVEVARGETDAEGVTTFAGLLPGSYQVVLNPPTGFSLEGETERTVEVVGGVHRVEVALLPEIARVVVTPDPLRLEVGASLAVSAVALTATGDTVRTLGSVEWTPVVPTFTLEANGLEATLTGTAPSAGPGSSTLRITVNGRPFNFPVTVSSFITGFIRQEAEAPATGPAAAGEGPEEPAPEQVQAQLEPGIGIGVVVRQDGTVVAREASGGDGRYRVPGLLAGQYTVSAIPTEERSPVPLAVAVTLDRNHPTGAADFLMTLAAVETVEVAPVDTLTALEQQVPLSVTPRDSLGNPLVRPATFASSDTTVARVTANGVVTAVGNGTATITVAVEGVVATTDVTVDQRATRITILDEPAPAGQVSPDSVRIFVADTGTAHWKAEDANGFPVVHESPTFTSSDPGVVTVDGSGHAQALSPGVADLTVELDGASDVLRVYVFGSYPDTYTVTGPADLADFAAGLYGKVTGSLVVEGTTLTDLSGLESLVEVGGSVIIRNNPSLADIWGLGGLETVGTDLVLENNDALTMPRGTSLVLEEVGEGVFVLDNDALTNLDFLGELAFMGFDLNITGNDRLEDMDGMVSLVHVPGSLLLRENPALSSTGNLPALQQVESSVVIEGGGVVVGLPGLRNVAGNLQVGGIAYDVSILEELYLPALTTVGLEVYVYGNPNLTTLDLAGLQSAGGMGGPQLRAGEASLDELGPVVAASRGETRRAGREARSKSRAQLLARRAELAPDAADPVPDPPRVRAPAEVVAVEYGYGGLTLAENPALTTLSVPSLLTLYGGLFLDGALGLDAVVFPALQEVHGSLELMRLDGPTTASFPALTLVGSYLSLYQTATLTHVSALLLNTTGGVSLYQNPVLRTFDVPALQEADDLWIDSNGTAETPLAPDFTSLSQVTYDVWITNNPGLGSLAFPSLTTVGYFFCVVNNAVLTTLSAPGLTTTGGEVCVERHPALAGFDLSSLEEARGGIYILDNEGLERFDFPSLVTTGSALALALPGQGAPPAPSPANDVVVLGNIGLTDFAFPLLEEVGVVRVGDNAALVTLGDMPALLPGASVRVEHNPALESLAGLDGIPALYELTVLGNDALQDMQGVSALTEVTILAIWSNPALTAITAFSSLTTVHKRLRILDNTVLAQVSFPGLARIGIGGGPSATHGILDVWDNPGLTSVAFPSLTAVDGALQVDSNDALTDLDWLSGVESALYRLVVQLNVSLTDVGGLSNVGTATGADPAVSNGVFIEYNEVLDECHATAVLDTIAERNGGNLATAFPGGHTVAWNLPCARE